MAEPEPALPPGLRLTLEDDPPPALRAELAREIHAFHAATVPGTPRRFALALHDADGQLAGGLTGVMHWNWLFVEALWVHPSLRGRGVGRALLARAERHAAEAGCRAAWLDTFQARGFYEAQGYTEFGRLEDYPDGQSRAFLRKPLR